MPSAMPYAVNTDLGGGAANAAIRIDPNRDLHLDANGDLEVLKGDLQLCNGTEGIRQSVLMRLRFFLAEWYLDLSKGLPYYQSFLVKNPNVAAISSDITSEILATPGIKEIRNFTPSYDRHARSYSAVFSAVSDTDQLLTDIKFEVPV